MQGAEGLHPASLRRSVSPDGADAPKAKSGKGKVRAKPVTIKKPVLKAKAPLVHVHDTGSESEQDDGHSAPAGDSDSDSSPLPSFVDDEAAESGDDGRKSDEDVDVQEEAGEDSFIDEYVPFPDVLQSRVYLSNAFVVVGLTAHSLSRRMKTRWRSSRSASLLQSA